MFLFVGGDGVVSVGGVFGVGGIVDAGVFRGGGRGCWFCVGALGSLLFWFAGVGSVLNQYINPSGT